MSAPEVCTARCAHSGISSDGTESLLPGLSVSSVPSVLYANTSVRSLSALRRVVAALAQESERLQHRADFGRLAAPSH